MKRKWKLMAYCLELEPGEKVVRGDLAKLQDTMQALLGFIEIGDSWASKPHSELGRRIHELASSEVKV